MKTCLECFEKKARGESLFCPDCRRKKKLNELPAPRTAYDSRPFKGDEPGPWQENARRAQEG